jgi:high-affinity Fe2+/Pb2+ permease
MPAMLWKMLAVLLYIVSTATAFAVLYALTVETTLAAVESAFGTFVILIMLLVFARKCWEKERAGPQEREVQPGHGSGKSL